MGLEQIGIGHPAVKDVLAILRNSAANRFGLVVAEGIWAARVVLDLDLRVDKFLLCPELLRSDDARGRARELSERARRSFQVSEKTMARMSERGEADGLLALVEMPVWNPEKLDLSMSALVLVSDGIEIPGNLGTLIRSLDACAADALVMTNRRTRMSHPKVFRGSQGMSLSVPNVEFDDVAGAIGWLKRNQFTVYLAGTSTSAPITGRTSLVDLQQRRSRLDHRFAELSRGLIYDLETAAPSAITAVRRHQTTERDLVEHRLTLGTCSTPGRTLNQRWCCCVFIGMMTQSQNRREIRHLTDARVPAPLPHPCRAAPATHRRGLMR